jgi:hypothetical protein
MSIIVSANIDTFLQSADNAAARTNLGVDDAPTAVADKATAYALTGVAVGTVYETADTGQIMEYLGDTQSKEIRANIVITGGTFTTASPVAVASGGGDTFALPNAIAGYYDASAQDLDALVGGDWMLALDGDGNGKWALSDQYMFGSDSFVSVENADSVHPADATWIPIYQGVTAPTVTRSETNESIPNNWKINGVVSVYDNDEKQLLTNLPDTQQVEVTGEAGRIERFKGDGEGIVWGGAIYIEGGTYQESGVGPVLDLTDGNELIVFDSTELTWFRSSGYEYITLNEASLGGGDKFNITSDASKGIGGTANKWGIYDQYYAGNIIAESTEDASTVHPANATWVAVGDGVTPPVVTRAPEATFSNWHTIKNTVYLTVNDAASSGGYDVNGVTVATGTIQGIGWVPVGESILTTKSTILYKLSKVDGDPSFTFGATVMDMVTVGYVFTLPNVFPSGATVEIKNA